LLEFFLLPDWPAGIVELDHQTNNGDFPYQAEPVIGFSCSNKGASEFL
jgi:hypothetical protein